MTSLSDCDVPAVKNRLHNLELNHVFVVFSGLLLLLLIGVTFLGVKQYFLFSHCREVVELSDQILFGFTSIKEHISETLLTGSRVDLAEVSREVERLSSEVKHIRDDQMIPEELKAPFLATINLFSLVVELRGLQGTATHTAAESRRFFASLRLTSEHLQQFNSSLTTYTQSLLLGLHRVLVGTLALVVFAVCNMMFFMYRCIAEPVIRLHRGICGLKCREDCAGDDPEVKAAVASLSSHIIARDNTGQRLENVVRCFDNVRNTLPEHGHDSDFWETLCLGLESNPDYLLVWVGLPEGDRLSSLPVTGCGCVSSAPSACRETITRMLAYCSKEGTLCATASKAIADQKVVVDVLSAVDLPDQLRSSLPFPESTLYSASFPVIHDATLTAVVTMYSTNQESFATGVLPLLESFFSFLAPKSTGVPCDNTILYSHAILGVLAAGRVHEITDFVNGALNYSQALLDLTDNGVLNERERDLLKKLHLDARKSASLTQDLTLLAGGYDSLPKRMPISLLIDQAIALLATDLRIEGIRVEVSHDKDTSQHVVPVEHLLLVLLTLLWRAAQYVAKNTVENQDKILQVLIAQEPEQKQLTLTIVGCPAESILVGDQQGNCPWPDLTTCSRLLANIHATLDSPSRSSSVELPRQVVVFHANKP